MCMCTSVCVFNKPPSGVQLVGNGCGACHACMRAHAAMRTTAFRYDTSTSSPPSLPPLPPRCAGSLRRPACSLAALQDDSPSMVCMTMSGMESGSDQEAPLNAMAMQHSVASGKRSCTYEPVNLAGSLASSERTEVVASSSGMAPNASDASFTSSSWLTAPAAART